MNRQRIPTPKIETIDGYLSLDECRKSIEFHARNINMDMTSPIINKHRVLSLRAVLDLFERYLKLIDEWV